MFSAHGFAARLSARQDRWPLLKGWSDAWCESFQIAEGYPEGELEKAEDGLGLKLPSSLKELYCFAGRRLSKMGSGLKGSDRVRCFHAYSACQMLALRQCRPCPQRSLQEGQTALPVPHLQIQCRTCKKYGRENPGGNAYDEKTKSLILAACHERSSLRGLSRTFGVSRNTVAAWLKSP